MPNSIKIGGRWLLGYTETGSEIYAGLESDILEDYILYTFPIFWWQKLRARLFGPVCIGTFKTIGASANYMKYFLFWCPVCYEFRVSYEHGFDSHMHCDECIERELNRVGL